MPLMLGLEIKAHVLGVRHVLRLTPSDTCALLRVEPPNDLRIAPQLKRLPSELTFALTPIHAKFKGSAELYLDPNTPCREVERRFWVSAFNSVFQCGWQETTVFPFLR